MAVAWRSFIPLLPEKSSISPRKSSAAGQAFSQYRATVPYFLPFGRSRRRASPTQSIPPTRANTPPSISSSESPSCFLSAILPSDQRASESTVETAANDIRGSENRLSPSLEILACPHRHGTTVSRLPPGRERGDQRPPSRATNPRWGPPSDTDPTPTRVSPPIRTSATPTQWARPSTCNRDHVFRRPSTDGPHTQWARPSTCNRDHVFRRPSTDGPRTQWARPSTCFCDWLERPPSSRTPHRSRVESHGTFFFWGWTRTAPLPVRRLVRTEGAGAGRPPTTAGR